MKATTKVIRDGKQSYDWRVEHTADYVKRLEKEIEEHKTKKDEETRALADLKNDFNLVSGLSKEQLKLAIDDCEATIKWYDEDTERKQKEIIETKTKPIICPTDKQLIEEALKDALNGVKRVSEWLDREEAEREPLAKSVLEDLEKIEQANEMNKQIEETIDTAPISETGKEALRYRRIWHYDTENKLYTNKKKLEELDKNIKHSKDTLTKLEKEIAEYTAYLSQFKE